MFLPTVPNIFPIYKHFIRTPFWKVIYSPSHGPAVDSRGRRMIYQKTQDTWYKDTKTLFLIRKRRQGDKNKELFFTLRNTNRRRVRSHKGWNDLIPVRDFKPAWKQVLFKWSFILLAAFPNGPIFWWTCVGISFRVVFTWYFITRN